MKDKNMFGKKSKIKKEYKLDKFEEHIAAELDGLQAGLSCISQQLNTSQRDLWKSLYERYPELKGKRAMVSNVDGKRVIEIME